MTEPWIWASVALMLPFALALLSLARGNVPDRLAGVQIASVVSILVLAAMDFAFDQPAAIDVALSLALLTLPGTLLFAVFQERWL